MTRLFPIVHVLALALAFSGTCSAGLITNGGFETGDFTGWTITQPGYGAIFVSSAAAYQGSYGVEIYRPVAWGVVGGITQTVATVPGQTYILSYWMRMDTELLFEAIWGPQPCTYATQGQNPDCAVVPGSYLLYSNNPNWTFYTFTVTATSTLTDLTLAGRSDFHTVYFDQVSLTNAVPEPGTLIMFGSGILGLAGILRRKINL